MVTRKLALLAVLPLAAGCGLENFLSNVGRASHPRPASVVRGAAAWTGARAAQLSVSDARGVFEPCKDFTDTRCVFATTVENGQYEIRLGSGKYSMIEVRGRVGDMELRAIVPTLGEESEVTGVDLDTRNMVEALIVEARLSSDASDLGKVTPSAYLGDGVSTGTRTLIRQALGQAGPTADLLTLVERLAARADPLSGATDPFLFRTPVLGAAPGYAVTTSPLDLGWLQRNQIDYTGDGVADGTGPFDTVLSQAAQLYRPAGCPDPAHVRLVFSVDFNDGCLDGTGNRIDRWKWLSPKTVQADHRMYFVGWLYTNDPPGASQVTDADVNAMLGAGVPNTVPMYDDGTNGDETGGDGIWTVVFDVPYDPALKLRVGYKYTWGTLGHIWTGTEEWPGNARMLEVVDVNGDAFVYRRDVFGDEATNKDRANLHPASGGSLTWDEGIHGCGPEAREQPFTLHDASRCGQSFFTPQAIGPLTVACTQ